MFTRLLNTTTGSAAHRNSSRYDVRRNHRGDNTPRETTSVDTTEASPESCLMPDWSVGGQEEEENDEEEEEEEAEEEDKESHADVAEEPADKATKKEL